MKFKFLSCVLAFALMAKTNFAQWAQTTTLEGGNVTSLLNVQNKVFASTPGGIFSRAIGSNWSFKGQEIGNNLGSLAVTLLASDGQNVFSVSGTYLNASTDQGNSWGSNKIAFKNKTDVVRSIALLDTVVYIMAGPPQQQGGGGLGGNTNGTYLLESKDKGKTYTEVITIPEDVVGGTLVNIKGTLYVYTDTIYTYDGTTFTGFSTAGIPDGSFLIGLTSDSSNLNVVGIQVAGQSATSAIYQYNNTLGWSSNSTSIPTTSLPFNLYMANNTFYTPTIDLATFAVSLYRKKSSDIGWLPVLANGLPPLNFQSAFAMGMVAFSDTVVLANTPVGVFSSSDFGDNWKVSNKNLLATNHNRIIGMDNTLITANNNPFIMLRSTNQGASYSPVTSSGMPATGFNALFKTDNTLYAGFVLVDPQTRTQSDSLFYSSDKGLTWNFMDNPGDDPVYTVIGTSAVNLYLRGSSGGQNPVFTYFRTSDRGATWKQVGVPAGIATFGGLTGDSSNLYIWGRSKSGKSQLIYRSLDFGSSFSIDTVGLGKNITNAKIAYSDSYFFLVNMDSTNNKNSLFAHGIGHNKWYSLNPTGLPTGEVAQVFQIHDKALYMIFASGVYRSLDGGRTFTLFNSGLYNGMNKTGLAFLSNSSHLSTNGDGIWNNGTLQAGVDPEFEPTGIVSYNPASSVELGQNHPNPAMLTTSINYAIAYADQVKLEVFDLQGRSVKVLVNENKAAGVYTATLDLTTLPSGIYSYKLSTSSSSLVKKMVVVK